MDNYTLTNNTAENNENGSDPNDMVQDKAELKEGAKAIFLTGLALSWLWTVLIVTLNLVVITIIYSYKKRNRLSRLYFFLLNLAIADLMAGLLDAFPNAIERSLGAGYYVPFWYGGDTLCKMLRTASSTSIMSSNYILAAMSLDRAYAICKPMMSIQKGSALQKLIVVICWVFCLICSSPYLRYNESRYYKPKFPFRDKQQCVITFGDTSEAQMYGHKVHLYLKFAFMFLVPVIIIMGSYILLVVFIFRRTLEQTPSEKKAEKAGDRTSKMSRVFNKGVPKSKMKSIKLTVGIVLSFIVCWMAYFIGYFLAMFANVRHPFLMVLTTFYYWNSIANPILFFIYHRKKFRTGTRPSWTTTETSHLNHRSTSGNGDHFKMENATNLLEREEHC